MADQLVSQAWMQVAMLPARVAYLVRAGSRSGLRRAVQEASTRWAGMTEPIVSVASGGRVDPWSRQVVGLLRADAVVNVDVAEADARKAAARFDLPLVSIRHIDHSGPSRFSCHPAALPDALGRDQFVVARVGGPLWEAVAVGDLTPEQERDVAATELVVHRPRTADAIGRAQLTAAGLLDHTVSHFGERIGSGGPWPCPAVVFVAREESFRDCVAYWNLRALRPLRIESVPMLLLPARSVEHWVGFAERLAELLKRLDQQAPDVFLVGGVAEDRLHEVAAILGLRRTKAKLRSTRKWPLPALREPPYSYRADLDPRAFFVFERSYGAQTELLVQVVGNEATLHFASPVPFRRGGHGTLVRFSGGPLDTLPRRESVAALVERNGRWANDGSFELATNAQREYRFTLRVPPRAEVVDTLLERAVPGFALSDKGRLGCALAAKAELDVLLSPGVYESIVALMTPRSRDLFRQLQRAASAESARLVEIAATWGGRAERRYRSPTQLRKAAGPDVARALESLVSMGWAERGFEVRCDRCGGTAFVLVPRTQGRTECPGCGAPATLTVEPTGPIVMYRLNSLVDRASDQGVLPHLLVVAALQRRDDHACLLPGVVFPLEGTRTGEVDIFGTMGSAVIAGEVKTSAPAFTSAQIRRDVTLTHRLGADVHLMAAVDEVPTAAVEVAKQEARRRKLDLIVLGLPDLRPS